MAAKQVAWMAGLTGAVVVASAAAAQPPPVSPTAFAETVASSHEFEILEGETAIAQSRDPRVRAFAQQMIQDHGRASQALIQAVATSSLQSPVMAVNADQARLLSGLQGLKGIEFDRLYATHQILAHQEALTVKQSYAIRGLDLNLKQAAGAAIPLIQHHLDMAQQLRAAVGG